MADRRSTLPARCDVAVIGAGIGGLTAAAVLSRAGLDVAVFEAQSQPGGYLSGFSRKGFTFDSSIHWLNHCAPGGFVHRLFGHIGTDFPRCRPLKRVCRCRGDSFEYLLTSDPARLRDEWIAEFPHEEKGIRALFEDGRVLGERWKLLDDRIRTPETMTGLQRIRRGLWMARWSFPMWRHLRGSMDRALARYFRDPALKKRFGRERSILAVLMPVAWASSRNYQAAPEGGSQSLVRWLCAKIESCGSRVLLNRRVARVRVDEHRRAAGVVLDGGEEVDARYVVAACDLPTLYERMLPADAVPRRLKEAVRKADLYFSHFSVFLGLDCDPRALGFGEEMLYLVRDDMSRDEHCGGDPHKTTITVLAPSVRDPSLAPPGKGTLAIHCSALMDHHDRWKTEDGLKRGTAYRAFKREYADILIDRVEKLAAPGLKQHIELVEIATPVTFWRYTGNKDGTIMATSPTPRNYRAGIAGHATPVRNLLLGGHWAENGGGVPIAVKAGANAGLIILQAERKAEFEKLKRVMDGEALDPVTIGIPRALCYYLHPGLWETFFRELGLDVVISEPTTRHTVERAGLISETEHCLPVKLFDAHLAALVGKVDKLFVPRILSTLPGHIACPKLGALPDCAQAQFGEETQILTVDVNEAAVPLEHSLRELGRSLKADEAAIRAASRRAIEVMHARRRAAAAGGGDAQRRFLVLAHPYNLHDEYLSGPVLRKLEALGVGVDRVSYDRAEVPRGPVKWDTCSVMHDTVQRLDAKTCAGVIELSSFNCGCDSIIGEIFRGMLKEKGIPYMALILDEHAAQAGVDTRLEAFVDSIGWNLAAASP